ncbi:MAG: LPS export ABC transporter periplasmic protein LptC [Gammaproteobacteria bacterium]
MTPRTAWMIAVFTILAVVSYFLAQDRAPQSATNDATLPSGYYLKGAVLSATDDSGIVRYQLRAERIDHDPVDGMITLSNLELDYGNTANVWRVNAASGTMPKSNNRIALAGDVTTRLLNAASHGATQMSSATLDINLRDETAVTEDAVTVMFEGGGLDAIGLDVDLANETFTLRSDVKGVFEAPTR